jgi:hypothetical protein
MQYYKGINDMRNQTMKTNVSWFKRIVESWLDPKR